jgi:hypothetical protein
LYVSQTNFAVNNRKFRVEIKGYACYKKLSSSLQEESTFQMQIRSKIDRNEVAKGVEAREVHFRCKLGLRLTEETRLQREWRTVQL